MPAVLALAASTLLVAWILVPRPALHIEVAPGGVATVHGRFGAQRPLPETVFVAARRDARVRIANRDTVAHRLGIFGAGAGAVAEYVIPQPGTYAGVCSAHGSSGQLTFVVR